MFQFIPHNAFPSVFLLSYLMSIQKSSIAGYTKRPKLSSTWDSRLSSLGIFHIPNTISYCLRINTV